MATPPEETAPNPQPWRYPVAAILLGACVLLVGVGSALWVGVGVGLVASGGLLGALGLLLALVE